MCAIRESDRLDLSSSMKLTTPTVDAIMSAMQPSKEDHQALMSNLRFLISRILIDKLCATLELISLLLDNTIYLASSEPDLSHDNRSCTSVQNAPRRTFIPWVELFTASS